MNRTILKSLQAILMTFILVFAMVGFPSIASANQYLKYSSDNTYPVQRTLDLSNLKVGQTMDLLSDNSNSIYINDNTSSNIKQPKIHCNDSSPAMSGGRIPSGNPDYRFELYYQYSTKVDCRGGASPYYRSYQQGNQTMNIVPMKLVLVKVADSGNTTPLRYPNFQMCKREGSTPDNDWACWRGENNGLSRYYPASSTATITVKPPIQDTSLTKAFSPTGIDEGETSTLTFTITENAQDDTQDNKVSFTDTLRDGLVVADPANVKNTCTAGTVTANVGGSTISVANTVLSNGTPSCSISVNVTSNKEGSYINGPSDVSGVVGGKSDSMTDQTLIVKKPQPSEPEPKPESPICKGDIEGTKPLSLTGVQNGKNPGQVGHPDGQLFKNINGIEGLDVIVRATSPYADGFAPFYVLGVQNRPTSTFSLEFNTPIAYTIKSNGNQLFRHESITLNDKVGGLKIDSIGGGLTGVKNANGVVFIGNSTGPNPVNPSAFQVSGNSKFLEYTYRDNGAKGVQPLIVEIPNIICEKPPEPPACDPNKPIPGAFSTIRIGDFDGFGFGEGEGLIATNGESVNVDGKDILSTGDSLPDKNGDGSFNNSKADNVTDAFDNRSDAEVTGTFLTGDGYEDMGSKGSDYTDVILGKSYTSLKSDRPFPDGDPKTKPNQPGFQFRFKVAKDKLPEGTPLFLNTVFADFDLLPVKVNLKNANGETFSKELEVAEKGERDASIQSSYLELSFNQVFSDGDANGEAGYWLGYLDVDFDAPEEGLTVYDFTELGTKKIPLTPCNELN